jgi:N-acetylmuramoyl-L-alanine amidase
MKTVFIGAGHSEQDPGAVSADRKLKEADLAVELRDAIVAQLFVRHVAAKADGSPGQNSPLRDSIAIAKMCDGPRVEIHFNAGPPTAKGIECLSLIEFKPLAQRLCLAISKHTKSPLRGQAGWKDQGSGQHHRLGFCLDAKGLILEVEFISNAAAMATYLEKRQAIAESIAEVLAEASGATAPLT